MKRRAKSTPKKNTPQPALAPSAGHQKATRPPTLTDDDLALWQAFVRSIRPLRPRFHAQNAPPSGVTTQNVPTPQASHFSILPAVTSPLPEKKSPSAKPLRPEPALQSPLRQKLVRGRKTIDARLDLHGYGQLDAHSALRQFILHAHHTDKRLLLVITGKGSANSGDVLRESGVLRRLLPHWLHLPDLSPLIVGFEPAHLRHGGEGAFYVHVRKA